MSGTQIEISLFQDPILEIHRQAEAIKAAKSWLKDAETDYPIELEDLILSLTDLQKQVKKAKEDFQKKLIEENTEYNEMREKLQDALEAHTNAKEALLQKVDVNGTEVDCTINVDGVPYRLQTRKELGAYLNGKLVK